MLYICDIQHADFSDRELGELDAPNAREKFSSHDWEAEENFRGLLKERGAEICPPNFGLYSNDSRESLRICLDEDGSWFFIFQFERASRVLGIFPKKSQEYHHVKNFPQDRVEELIDTFYRGDFQTILALS